MSDTDDTDVLLLIPPNYFVLNTSPINSTENLEEEFSLDNCNAFYQNMSGNYYHLPPRHQIELSNIDARLSQIEKEFQTSCEISSITNETVQQIHHQQQQQHQDDPIYHSTPLQCGLSSMKKNLLPSEDAYKVPENIITEIDRFLEKSDANSRQSIKISNPISSTSLNQVNSTGASSVFQLPAPEDENKLISLNELWNTNNNGVCNERLSLQEERLRRQHCEKVIKALQNRLLEYQQKISVAIQVDRTKDNVLEKIQEENHRLRVLTNELDDRLQNFEKQKNEFSEKLRTENEEFKLQKESLEKELSQALNLVTKLQDKNEILETKVENLTKASTEVGSIYKKQIEDLEMKLSNHQKDEHILNEEFNKLKAQYENLKLNHENINKENSELKNKLESQKNQLEQLKHNRLILNNKYDETRKKIDELEKKNKDLEEYNHEISEKEKCFLKEFESQRITLKSHYQQQLENVVAQKLKEFQSQLDSVEESIRQEAKERERLIAERAIKQVEMINEKNEQEILLINERHNKEVELYRIQLANSVKKINELEEIIEDYRSRRADIAEKLHNIMETQWKKALEILTSPNGVINNNTSNENSQSRIDSQNIHDQDKLDGLQKCNKVIKTRAENEYFETPKSSTHYHNLKFGNDQKNIDRLQAYIEMNLHSKLELLNKSPSDLENLQEILAMPKNTTSNRHLNKNEKTKCENTSTKPPWK